MVVGIDASRATVGQRTGTEAYAYHLSRALIPLATSRGHSLRFYFNQPPAEGLFPETRNLESVVIPFGRLWTHIRLAWELQQRPPDVFFTPAHVIPFSFMGPSVATVHDLGFLYFPTAHGRKQLAYLSWSTRHNVRRSRRVVADSKATKSDLIRHYGVEADDVDVVYPGLDPWLKPVRDVETLTAAQRKYRIGVPYLLYIGTLQPRKNLERLIDAYAASGLNCQLVLAGKVGWLAESILDRIRNMRPEVQERIILPGFIEEEDKAAVISGAAGLLFPSLYEGFGFPVLEANVCGTPVLSANRSSLPEVAGDSAILVEPSDTNAIASAMYRLVVDNNLRQQLVQKGRINAGRFSWKKAANQVLTVLERAYSPPMTTTNA